MVYHSQAEFVISFESLFNVKRMDVHLINLWICINNKLRIQKGKGILLLYFLINLLKILKTFSISSNRHWNYKLYNIFVFTNIIWYHLYVESKK